MGSPTKCRLPVWPRRSTTLARYRSAGSTLIVTRLGAAKPGIQHESREPQRLPASTAKRSRAHRVRPRYPHCARRLLRSRPGDAGALATARIGRTQSRSTTISMDRPVTATATSRRSCCAASTICTSPSPYLLDTASGLRWLYATLPAGKCNVHRVGFGAMQLPGRACSARPGPRPGVGGAAPGRSTRASPHRHRAVLRPRRRANELIRAALHPYPDNLALVSKVGCKRDDKGAWLPDAEPPAARRHRNNLRSLGSTIGRSEPAGPGRTEPDQLFTDQLRGDDRRS